MSIKAYYLNPDGLLEQEVDEGRAGDALASGRGLLWVDILDTDEDDGKYLDRVFHFHRLAIEDCVSPTIHPPKIDDFNDYIFIIAHGINHTIEAETVETAELAVFIGKNYVVTDHNYPLYSVENIHRQVVEDGRPMKKGADFLAHALLDNLIDNILPSIDRMTDVAEEVEAETIENPRQSTLEAILKLKRSALQVHRVMAPQREVFNRLSRGDYPLIKEEAQIFYRDIYDHVVRIEDLNQTIRDISDNILSTYLSSVANRQNEVMKTLAIVATIFMPLTLLVGIYGMNFTNMPELGWKYGYFVVLGVILVAIISVLWRFWSKGWLAWGRSHISRVSSFAVEPEKLVGFISENIKKNLQK